LRADPWLVDPAAPPSPIAVLEAERFAAMEDYMQRLSTRRVDLAICLDCTASMSGELAAAQAGVDDLMGFVGDVVAELRVAIVAYRDRRDRDFETKAWDFMTSADDARRRLWMLSADGGGDSPEAVEPALRLAYTKLSWNVEHTRVLVLIGDAPPHVGYGTRCVEMAARAAANGLVTNVIQTEDDAVKHFPEIAAAGEGRCVSLSDDDRLIAEIAGLALGDRYGDELRGFFSDYLVLCR
jgi:Mg-chelatase subunit ChlD